MQSFPGLDFGTTNSTLALAGRRTASGEAPPPARLLCLEGDSPTIPSALFFSLEDGETRFGRAAIAEYVEGVDGRFMRALKSILGTSLMKEKTLVGRDRVSFEWLIARFLAKLRETLERETGRPAEAVVMGRPVRFVDESEAADREAEAQLAAAARSAGFAHVEFQYEPVAAALFHETRVSSEELALVVDIGGGTSDFALVRVSPERAKARDRREDILAFSGVHVGGTDFDRLLNIARMQPQFGLGTETADGKRRLPVWYFNDMATWHRINFLYAPKVLADIRSLRREAAEPGKLERYEHLLANRSGHRLAGAVEAAKIRLSDAEETEIRLREPGLDVRAVATRDQFEAATAELVARIETAIDRVMREAGIEPAAVDTVILTGGGALVPAVHRAATARFGGARVAPADAFGAVGLGLGLDAARRFG